MRASLVLWMFVSYVAANQPQFKQNKEYIYDFYGRTLTAIPDLKNQYVGVVNKGKIVLQVENESQINGKLLTSLTGHFHDNLEDVNTQIPDNDLQFNEMNIQNHQFSLKFNKGVVESVTVDSSLTNDQVNQLKAILGQLQVDTHGINLIKSRHNQLPQEKMHPNALYKTMEASITGECETIYDISPLQEALVEQIESKWAPKVQFDAEGEFFQVVKTLNYSHCEHRKGYHFGITGASDLKPGTNQMGEFLSKASTTRIIANGNVKDYTIQQATTTNRVAVRPSMYQEQFAQVIGQIQLTLVKVKDISNRLMKLENGVNTGNLVYRYNIPSDQNNKIREGIYNYVTKQHGDSNSSRSSSSSSSSTSASSRSSSSSSSSESDEDQNKNQQKNTVNRSEKNQRVTRSVGEKTLKIKDNKNGKSSSSYSSSSSPSSSSSSSLEEETENGQYKHFQPKPSLTDAPEFPFHPYSIGFQGRSIKYSDKINLESEVSKLSYEIGQDLENQDQIPRRNTLQKFDILTDLIRMMNQEQIHNVAQQLNLEHNKQDKQSLVKKSFKDAVAQAGTGPSVVAVAKWISGGKVKGEEAATIFSTLTKSIRTPTNEVILELFNKVVKNSEIRNQRYFYSNVVISFTDLVRRAYVDPDSAKNYYPTQTFTSFRNQLNKVVKQQVIPYFAENLKKSVEQKQSRDILLSIRALGNIAHPYVITIFEKYFDNDDKLSTFQRTAMVLALDKVTNIYPKQIRDILFKIYSNTNEQSETRSIAVMLIMRTSPPASMLQRMAEFTNEDPSVAVQATVKSAILSAASLKDKNDHYFADNAQAAAKFLNPRQYGIQYSKTQFRDYVSQNLELTYKSQLSHIVGEEHVLPRGIWYDALRNYAGLKTKSAEVQVMLSNVEQVLNICPNPEETNQEDQSRKLKRDSNAKWTTEYISKQFNINEEEAREFEGQILMNLIGRKSFMTFNERSIKDLPHVFATILKEGKEFNYNHLFNRREVSVAFPLATGYPFYYTFRIPTLLQALGEFKISTLPDLTKNLSWESVKNMKALNVTGKVHLVHSTEQNAEIGFIAPSKNYRYVAGYVRKTQTHVPLQFKLDIDFENNNVNGKLQAIDNNQDFKLFHSSAWPYTTRRSVFNLRPAAEDIENLKKLSARPIKQLEKVIGEKSTGMVFRGKFEHQLPSVVVEKLNKMLRKQGQIALTRMPYSYQTVMQGLMRQQSWTIFDFIPYALKPAAYGSNLPHAVLSTFSMPYYDDFTPEEIVHVQGLLWLTTNSISDAGILEKTAESSGILYTGTQWPYSTLDHYNFNIKYDAKRSVNKVVKFSFALNKAYNIDQENHARTQRMKHAASVDEKLLGLPQDQSPNSEERRQQLLANAAFGMKYASAGVIDSSIVFAGENQTEYVMTIAQADSSVDEKERVLLFLSVKPFSKSRSQQIGVTYTGKYPNTPALNFENALKHNGQSSARVNIVFGQDQKINGQVNIKVQMEQTKEYKNYLQNSQVGHDCLSEMKKGYYQMHNCMNATYHANLLDRIQISVNIENETPVLRNITNRALNMLRHAGMNMMEENINEIGKQNQFRAVIGISAHIHSINITLQTPEKLLKFDNLPVENKLRPLLAIHPGMNFYHMYQRNAFRNGHVCTIEKDLIQTFDHAMIENQKIGNCWYTMFQYTPTKYAIRRRQNRNEEPQEISVLVRQETDNTQMKAIKLIVAEAKGKQHTINLSTSGSSFTLNIDGKEEKLSESKPIQCFDNDNKQYQQPSIEITELPSNQVKIQISDQLRVYFNGHTIRIHVDEPNYRNNTLGLCGTFNGELVDDLTTPKRCLLRNDKFFASTWAIADETCSSKIIEEHKKAQQKRCLQMMSYSGNSINTNLKTGKWIWNSASSSSSGSNRSGGRSSSGSSSSSSSSSSINSGSSSSSENGNSSSSKNFSSAKQNKTNNKRSHENLNNKKQNEKCYLRQQMQVVQSKGQTCFTLKKIPTCPNHCKGENKEQKEFSVYCRDSNDSVSRMYAQQVRKGVNLDLGTKEATKQLTFNVPTVCTN